ncbi:SCO6745 family protein [Kitasatospora terrestris]|uniref:SalK n=1 Tax=Kitasatospora terrestris TaxID=258051 RepID=A0ABP9DGK5_9ACTN
MPFDRALPRRAWHHLEPAHAVLYFAPEAFAEAARLGYDVEDRWPSYFAWRAAPLGAVGAELTAAAFYSFSPAAVARHVPAAWAVAEPAAVLDARLRAVDATYRALFGEPAGMPDLAELVGLARRAADAAAADSAGRPLTAANAALGPAEEPHLDLWQALTVLREHRGDGHLAALMAAGLDPCESLVSFAAIGAAPAANFAGRGWTGQEWAAATERLAARGWVDADGAATERGRAGRNEVERLTDQLAAAPWRALGTAGTERFMELMVPLFLAVIRSGLLPAQSTLGVTTVPAPTW